MNFVCLNSTVFDASNEEKLLATLALRAQAMASLVLKIPGAGVDLTHDASVNKY